MSDLSLAPLALERSRSQLPVSAYFDPDLYQRELRAIFAARPRYLGHALAPYRLYFYEDPIRPLNPLSLRLVRDKVNLPIAIGEPSAR